MLSATRISTTRKRYISEVEKLTATGCVGKQYRPSRRRFVTPPEEQTPTLDDGLLEDFDCCVRIADDHDVDSDSDASEDSSDFDEDYISDHCMPGLMPRKEDINRQDDESVCSGLPDLLPAEDNDTIYDEQDLPDLLPAVDDDTNTDSEDMNELEANEDDIFVKEIIAELELEQNNKTTFVFENLPGSRLDGMTDESAHGTLHNNRNVPLFADIPAVLVDDDNSVCYPCVLDNVSPEILTVVEGPNAEAVEEKSNNQGKKKKRKRGRILLVTAYLTETNFAKNWNKPCLFTVHP